MDGLQALGLTIVSMNFDVLRQQRYFELKKMRYSLDECSKTGEEKRERERTQEEKKVGVINEKLPNLIACLRRLSVIIVST